MTRLGIEYRDRITGFVGMATGKCAYISGCSQTLLAPRSKDGAFVDSQWIDDQRLEEALPGTPPLTLENGDTPGCDRCAPKR